MQGVEASPVFCELLIKLMRVEEENESLSGSNALGQSNYLPNKNHQWSFTFRSTFAHSACRALKQAPCSASSWWSSWELIIMRLARNFWTYFPKFQSFRLSKCNETTCSYGMARDCYQGNGQSERELKRLWYPYPPPPRAWCDISITTRFAIFVVVVVIGKPQQAFKASLQGARDISW